MSDQAIDYTALADQARARRPVPAPPKTDPTTTSPSVDYAALAKQARDGTGEQTDGAISRFVEGVGDTLLPSTTANDYNFFDTKGGAGYAVRHPIDSAGLLLGAIKDAHVGQARKMAEAYDRLRKSSSVEDRLSAAADLFQHAAGTIVPLVGPAASSAVDTMKEGDVARGAGQLTGIIAPIAAGKVAGKVVPKATALADVADRVATEKMADAIAPKVGRQKQRFGNMATEVSAGPEGNPEAGLLRRPEMNALSRAGLQAKVESAFEDAKQALDAAHDARNPATARFPTKSVVDALTAERQKLVAEPIEGNKIGYQRITVEGKPATTWIQNKGPIGQEVVPPQNQAAYNALSTAIDNVTKLGPMASYDDLRTLRMAWDKSAEKIYTPSVVQDFLTARDEGLSWSKASGQMRDFLAAKDPTTAKANADYSLLRRAHDVLAVTEETERTRPHRGSQMVMSGVGALAGSHYGSAGIVAGALLGPAVDAAMTSGVTTKITTARLLASLSDALRTGKDSQALNTLRQVAKVTGQTSRFDALLKQVRESSAGTPKAASATPNESPETVRR